MLIMSQNKSLMDSTYICKECGSDNVYWLRWINANNGELKLNQAGTELLLEWCENCGSETIIVENNINP